MSDFSDWVQKELPFRPSVDEVADTGSLLVKKDNLYSRDYEPLSQGTTGQILKSQGVGNVPIWDDVPSPIITEHNDNGGTIIFGQPVYLKSNGNIDLAQADSVNTYKVLALVADDSILTDADGNFQFSDILTGTTDQWDAITGETGGLTVGDYYLDPSTAGKLTKIVPSTITQFIVPIGTALSTIDFKINIHRGVQL